MIRLISSVLASIVHWLLQHQNLMALVFGLLTLGFGVAGHLLLGKDFLAALSNGVSHFSLEVPPTANWLVHVSVIFASITISFILILTLLKRFSDRWIVNALASKEHILAIGLGENNRYFINSVIRDKMKNGRQLIVVDKHVDEASAEEYRRQGVGVMQIDAGSGGGEIQRFLQQATLIIISTGDDRQNIDISKTILDRAQQDTRILVHVVNRNLNQLYSKLLLDLKKASSAQEGATEIVTFSYYSAAARSLFSNYRLLPQGWQGPVEIAVCGVSQLAVEVIYLAIQLHQNPSQEALTIHLLDEDPESLLKKLSYEYSSIHLIPRLSFRCHTVAVESREFFGLDIWRSPTLVGAYLCRESEAENLQAAIDLNDRVLNDRVASDDEYCPRVFTAIYNKMELSHALNSDLDSFSNIFTFSSSDEVSDYENLVDERNDLIAKMIHFGYGEIFDSDLIFDPKQYEAKWVEASFSDRESSRSQALHIDSKLHYLGLSRVRPETDLTGNERELLSQNRVVLDEVLELTPEYYNQITSFSDNKNHWELFDFDILSPIEKLARSEHDRWNAYHWLNGWKLGAKDKKRKYHPCLKELSDFEDDIKPTVIYDLYSVLYIPNFLASGNWILVRDDNER